MPETLHPAPVGRIHLNLFDAGGQFKSRSRKIVPDDCLEVAISQSAAWCERRQPFWKKGRNARFVGYGGIGIDWIVGNGGCHVRLVIHYLTAGSRKFLERLVGIERFNCFRFL